MWEQHTHMYIVQSLYTRIVVFPIGELWHGTNTAAHTNTAMCVCTVNMVNCPTSLDIRLVLCIWLVLRICTNTAQTGPISIQYACIYKDTCMYICVLYTCTYMYIQGLKLQNVLIGTYRTQHNLYIHNC